MKVVAAFTKHNPVYSFLNHPEEDAYRLLESDDKLIIAVADGITRDPIGILHLPEYNDKEKLAEAFKNYPRPSPAKKAADIFCGEFVNYASILKFGDKMIIDSFRYCNKKIKELNKEDKTNYLDNDYAACVASVGVIKDNTLEWGFIADCGVAIFNSKGKIKFMTPPEGPSKEIDKEAERRGKKWSDPEWRKVVRSKYRNNPENPDSYGALTGEINATRYIRTGRINLSKGDFVILYTDGFYSLIKSKDFDVKTKNIKEFFDNNLNKIDGSEGTLVLLRV